MAIREFLNVLERVDEIATLAGMGGQINEDRLRFEMGFGLDNGRSQVVYVRPLPVSTKSPIITIFSPCLVKKKGMFQGISKKMAIDLLRRNEQVVFARYGICKLEDGDVIMASADHILETLDPPEFGASAYHVALAADMYEREHGQDEF
jgi:hypothetical protein